MVLGDTEILTNEGWLTAKYLADAGSPDIFIAETGKFDIQSYVWSSTKWDEFFTYTLVPYNNTGNQRVWEFKAPRPCGVNLRGVDHTFDLRLGDNLRANPHDCGYDPSAWANGFMYRLGIMGLGGIDPKRYPLYRAKLEDLKTQGEIKTPDGSLPHGETPTHIGSFIRGYLSADGFKDSMATSNEEWFKFFVDYHGFAGLVLTGGERKVRKMIKLDRKTTFYTELNIRYCKGAEFQGYRVSEIAGPSTEAYTLYGACLPEGVSFVIKGGWTLKGD